MAMNAKKNSQAQVEHAREHAKQKHQVPGMDKRLNGPNRPAE